MPEIRTKNTAKAPIKTYNHAADFAGRIKKGVVRTRKAAETSVDAKENNPNEYASDRIQHTADTAAQEVAYRTKQISNKVVKRAKDKKSASRGQTRQHYQISGEQNRQTTSSHSVQGDNVDNSAVHFRQGRIQKRATEAAKTKNAAVKESSGKMIRTKTGQASYRPIKVRSTKKALSGIKTAGKHSFRTVDNSVKTAEKATKTAAKNAKRTAQAAKKAAQATKAAAKAAKAGIKATVAAVKALIKAIIAAAKALAAAISAGGWVAVLIIVVILLVVLILCSVFGVFASGEDSGNGMSMRTAVSAINEEYNQKIENIKSANTYDVLEMKGSRAEWKEVIAVYAVKLNTDPDEAKEVATMDYDRIGILKSIFWEMNTISSEIKTETHVEKKEKIGEDGKKVIVKTTTETKTLCITVNHLTVDEIADHYYFTQEQKEMLYELIGEKYNALWSTVLSGVTSSDEDIVNVAVNQLGNVGGQPYWSWYGFTSRVEWCCCFVSWCENQCGYIEAGIAPMYSVVDTGVNWFRNKGQWLEGSEEPRPGMIIFFDWAYDVLDGSGDHTGIVEKVENGYVYTIEGNSGDACKECMYSIGHNEILGYGYIKPR